MRDLLVIATLLAPLVLAQCAVPPPPVARGARQPPPGGVLGMHLLGWTSDESLAELGQVIPDLAARGVNLLFLEVDYSFAFQSHPELRQGPPYITPEGARQLAAICRRHGIRLVPQFQCVGHQSWAQHTAPLLTVYPELDLTPGAFPGNEGLYCREWDVANPRVNQIVFALIDEIVAAFAADGIHVGMDEIFLLGSEHSPSTRGQDPGELFAQVVNEFHAYLVEQRGLEMFMWGDRLIDGTKYPYGEWEASLTGTAAAVDRTPKDIVICDWHYEPMAAYPSVPMFLKKGFRVLPCSWRKVEGVRALVKQTYRLQHPRMLGHVFTTWRRLRADEVAEYPPMVAGIETIRSGRFYDVGFELRDVSAQGVLRVALRAPASGLQIHYTTDGTAPTPASPRYGRPLRLERTTTVQAIACRRQAVVSDITEQRFLVHLATGRPVALATPPSPKYPPARGPAALVDGVTGSSSYADGQWVGAEGVDLEATIDLGRPTGVAAVSVRSLHEPANWVHHSPLVEVFGSADGRTFVPLGRATQDAATEAGVVTLRAALAPGPSRYLRVLVHNQTIPAGHPGAGSGAWLFVDEIVVE